MKTGTTPDPGSGAHEALARASWDRLLPQLLRGACHYLRALGWAEGHDHRPAVLEGRELLNTAVEGFLSGHRAWPLPPGASEDSLVRVLSKAMFNVAMGRRKLAAVTRRAAGGDALDQQMDESPTASQRFSEQALLERLRETFAADAEALTLLDTFAEGFTKREDIAEELGWAPDQVSLVRRRMRRRLDGLHLTTTADRDAEPPSSSPRWRHDETDPSPGQRHRAPGQRDRGARVAGRRRGPDR
jgi:hypothetical protein